MAPSNSTIEIMVNTEEAYTKDTDEYTNIFEDDTILEAGNVMAVREELVQKINIMFLK